VWDVDKNRKKLIAGGELQFSHPSHKAATATVYTRYQSISAYTDRMPRGMPVHIIRYNGYTIFIQPTSGYIRASSHIVKAARGTCFLESRYTLYGIGTCARFKIILRERVQLAIALRRGLRYILFLYKFCYTCSYVFIYRKE